MASKGSEAMVSNEMGDLDGDSLVMHRTGRPGKIEIIATKPLVTQRDLALAYSPGVAAPCLEIAKDHLSSFDYTIQDNGQTNGTDDFKSATGHVTFTVTEANDVPTATADTLSDIT